MTTETTAYHVLFLASWFPNKEFKTLGNFVKRHAKAVSSLHQVSVLYTYPSENASDYNWEVNHQDNYHEYILYYPKKRPNVFFSSRAFKVALAKFEAENELKVDLIHLNVLYPAARQALYLNRKWDIPFLVTEHWTGFHSDTHSTIKPWQKALMKTAVNKASFVCPVSEHLGVAMRKHGLEGAYKVVPNVVDTKLFKLPTEKEQKAYTFLHVSSLLDQHKNVSGLLRAFKKLTENHTDVFLQIVGDGDISPHVNYANELGIPPAQLSFEGEQPLDQIASYMRQADNFVLFSNYENLPCVIGESFASGIPVISTDVGGISEHMPDFGGHLINKQDEAALYEAMKESITANHVSKEELRSYAEKNFSVHAIARAYSELYTKMMEESC